MSKILIIFDSDTSENESLAKLSESILIKLKTNVRVRKVASVGISKESKDEHYISNSITIQKDDLIWADSYIFTFPIHTGTITASLKYFFDSYHQNISEGIFVDKFVTGMCVGKIPHAGAETAIQHLYSMLMQWGCITVSTSIAFPQLMELNGNPYGLSFVLDDKNTFGDMHKVEEVLTIHLNRFIKIVDAFDPDSNTQQKKESNNSAYNIVDSLS